MVLSMCNIYQYSMTIDKCVLGGTESLLQSLSYLEIIRKHFSQLKLQ